MIVTLTPNPSLDRTLFLDTFTRGAVNRCTATLAEPSGKGINVALALHRHGVGVLAVLPIGGPAGRQLVQLLDTAGLPYRAVTITGTIRTNVSIIEAEGTSSKINEPGPTLTSEEVEELVRTTLDSCSSADWLAICGTLPNGFSERHMVEAVRAARTAGLRVALDTSGLMLRAVLIATPHLVKPNAHELAEATGRPIRTIGDVTAAAEQLRAKGLGTVLVSLGRGRRSPGRRQRRTYTDVPQQSPLSTLLVPVMHFWRATSQPRPTRHSRRSACLGVAVGRDSSPTPRHAVVSGR